MRRAANRPLQSVLKAVAVQFRRGAADQELLQRFIATNDEAAFRVIAERHGPMVLGVCRRALGCPFDADDAFQATFLIFARKADSIRKTASLGGWLHGVAMRVAGRVQRDRKRRLRHEQSPKQPRLQPTTADEMTWAEVRTGLDEELQHLPENYREVLVLCYLEGKTRDEAAQQLGLTQSAVHGRLERGRKLLADRLTRRGLTLSAGLLAVAVAPAAMVAAVRAASLFAARQSIDQVVTPTVLSITNGILKGMTMSKLKLVFASVVCVLFLVAGVGFTPAQAPPGASELLVKEGSVFKLKLAADAIATLDTDEAYIRRVSKDLRGVEPTPTEVHFFVNNRDAKKRDTLVDLFVREREAKKKAEEAARAKAESESRLWFTTKVRSEAVRVRVTHYVDQPNLEVSLLKTKVERARIDIQEKEIVLKLAQQKKSLNVDQRIEDERRIKVLELELAKARVQLQEAELNLSAAEKKVRK